jgi:hypothetical protein
LPQATYEPLPAELHAVDETRPSAGLSGRHAADPGTVRAEIEEVLAYGHDEDQWIRDLEARLARAAANVRKQRERLHGG